MKRKANLTIDDIAEALGVSKTTVSRVLSGKGRISQATRERVLAYTEKNHYQPSAAAKALAESKTYNLALVLPCTFISLDLSFIRQSMSAICEEAFTRDYHILICLCTDDAPEHLTRTLDHRKVDGVILSRTVENDRIVDILIDRQIPFATLGTLPPQTHGKAQVEADHDQVGGCRAFSADFLRTGQGKAALLGNDMNYVVNQSRLTGFRQAMADCHFPEDAVYLRFDIRDAESCAQVVDQLLLQGVRRFLAMDDDVCLHILEHLKNRRLAVPEQIQVASLCAGEQLEENYPHLPALHFDAAALGRAACRELLRYLHKEDFDPAPLLGYRL